MKKDMHIFHVLVVLLLVACSNETIETNQTNKKKSSVDSASITIDLYVKEACGATKPTIELVEDIIGQMETASQLNIVMLQSSNEASELKVIGVPTIRVNGIDIDPAAKQIQKYGITWRKYGVSEIPPKEMIIKAVKRAIEATGDGKAG